MEKSIELTQSQIEVFKNGATKFIFPINQNIELIINDIDKEYGNVLRYKEKGIDKTNLIDYEDFYLDWSPVQKGDKNIFIKEDFYIDQAFDVNYKFDNLRTDLSFLRKAEEMNIEQCRFKFEECINIEIFRVQDLKLKDWQECGSCLFDSKKFYNKLMQEFEINRTHKDNDYVFLLEFKRN